MFENEHRIVDLGVYLMEIDILVIISFELIMHGGVDRICVGRSVMGSNADNRCGILNIWLMYWISRSHVFRLNNNVRGPFLLLFICQMQTLTFPVG